MERKPFNWSILTRDALYGLLNSIQNKIVDHNLAVEDIHSILSKHIKKYLPIKVRLDRDIKNDKGYIYVGGT